MSTSTGVFSRRLTLLIAVLAVLIVATGAYLLRDSTGGMQRGTVEISREGRTVAMFDVEMALTPKDQAKGLMDRESLPEDQGMAFIFDHTVRTAFYMKNTLIPLDIAFWDASGKIVNIQTMTPCDVEPCPLYDPGTEIVGALEVNAGLLDSTGVGVGDLVKIEES